MRIDHLMLSVGASEEVTHAESSAPPQVNVRDRMKGLRRGEQWSLDGLTLLLFFVGLVAAAAVSAALVSRRNRLRREAERAKAATKKTPPAPGNGRAVRFELGTGAAKPAIVMSEKALENLKPGTAVHVLGDAPGSEIYKARITSRNDSRICFVLNASARKLSDRVFLARRRFDAEFIVYAFHLAPPPNSKARDIIEGTLDKDTRVIRLQVAGTVPADTVGILFMTPASDPENIEAPSVPTRQVNVSAIGIGRMWLKDADDIPMDQQMILRCAIPGEADSAEFTVKRRADRTDRNQRPVVELSLEPRTPIDHARVVRYVTLQAHAALGKPTKEPAA